MSSTFHANDIAEPYAPEAIAYQDPNNPAVQALGFLADAWRALEALEASLSQELPRWDAESLMTARKGTQRAWLALSNLHRSMCARRRQSQDGHQP